MPYAEPHRVFPCNGIFNGVLTLHWTCNLLKYSMRWPDACILIVTVRIAAITLREFPWRRLSGSVGSNSQIAAVVLIVAAFVMWAMTSPFARLTTCSKHLAKGSDEGDCQVLAYGLTYGNWFAFADHSGRWRRWWMASIVSHSVPFDEVLSRVAE